MTKQTFDIFISIYTSAKPQEIKQALLEWGQKYGLTESLLKKCFEVDFVWKPVSHYIFDVNYDNDEWIFLDKAKEKESYEELLSKLKALDNNVEVYSEWANLTKLFELQRKVEDAQKQLKAQETMLEEEECRVDNERIIHETSEYEETERVVNEESTKKIKKFIEEKKA